MYVLRKSDLIRKTALMQKLLYLIVLCLSWHRTSAQYHIPPPPPSAPMYYGYGNGYSRYNHPQYYNPNNVASFTAGVVIAGITYYLIDQATKPKVRWQGQSIQQSPAIPIYTDYTYWDGYEWVYTQKITGYKWWDGHRWMYHYYTE